MRTNFIIIALFLCSWSTVQAELQIIFEERELELSQGSGKKKKVLPPREVILRIGAGYFYTIRDGMVKAYDFPRRKIMYIKDGQKIRETPFFAVVSERLEGFLQETETFQLLSKAGVLKERDRYGIFNLESKYAMQTDIRSAVRPQKLPSGKGKYAYNLGSDMVAIQELSDIALIRQEPEMFGRFLLYECQLHPEIRKDMIIYRKVPQMLIYRYGVGAGRKEVTLSLQSAKRIKDTVFTKELRGAPRPPVGELEKIFVEAKSTANENSISEQQYGKMFDASLEKGFYLDAMLITVEVYLQSGAGTQNAMQRLKPFFDKDPNLDRFVDGLDGSSRKSAAISLKLLEEIDRSNVFRQHVIDATVANALKNTNKFVEAEKRYLEALRSNPYLTGIYVDLGDLYYRMHLMDKAWSAWQLAKDMYPDHPMLEIVDERNEFLLVSFPEYF